MKKRILLIMIALNMVFAACQAQVVAPVIQVEVEVDAVDLLLQEMTLDEKIAQMFIIGFPDSELDEQTAKLIQEQKIGGVILFNRNITDLNQLQSLTNALKECNAENLLPLWIGVDQEGGQVQRLPEGATKIPSARRVGATQDPLLAQAIGQVTAEELTALGFNLDFAPVLDVDSNPLNPVIGPRAYSRDAETVAEIAVAVMQGLQAGGVVPVGKHFPGHGDTDVDSHLGLPVINHSLERLRSVELKPFQAAINAGMEMIMASHIVFSALDADGNPATLSQPVLSGLLREELGFDGVIVTDDMEMSAIVDSYNFEDAVVHAVQAGADVLLVCHTYERQLSAILVLQQAVDNGIIDEHRIDESVRRIIKLKQGNNLADAVMSAENLASVGSQAHQDVVDAINK